MAKRKLETCAPAKTCAELTDCLSTQHCTWILRGPDDHDPKFSCL